MPASTRLFFVIALLCAAATASLRAATFTVTNTNDSGPGSLRQALLDAYGSTPNEIHFAIGSGVQTIRPLTQLPFFVTGTIDGATQPGYAGSPLIQIDGSLLPAFSAGITIGANINGPAGAVVKALVVNNCHWGIRVDNNVRLTGSFIGTDVTGTVARPNTVGIYLFGEEGSVIGGTTDADRNVISGNLSAGVLVGVPATILGNFIGTNAAGTAALPNLNDGITVQSVFSKTPSVVIGGVVPGAGNLISGNGQYGIALNGADDVTIQGNWIGAAAFGGTLSGPTQRAGIVLSGSSRALIGGDGPGEGNVITNQQAVAIGIQGVSNRNVISGNSIHSNAFGIDLNYELNQAASRVTPNDAGDEDIGPNLLQNFPVIESVLSAQGSATMRGTLNSSPNSSFRIEFFSNATCNASGHGEGRTYLGFTNVSTDPAGNALFETVLPVSILPTDAVTATATDEFGDTSEFSACKPVGLKFFTVEPCRVVDTRNPDDPLGGPALFAHSFRVFALANTCGIPASAASVAVNLTTTQASAAGNLTIHRLGIGTPLASSANFPVDKARATNAILGVSSDGSGSIVVVNASPGTVHLILDVTGYFQ